MPTRRIMSKDIVYTSGGLLHDSLARNDLPDALQKLGREYTELDNEFLATSANHLITAPLRRARTSDARDRIERQAPTVGPDSETGENSKTGPAGIRFQWRCDLITI
jgi:hypothetical protein